MRLRTGHGKGVPGVPGAAECFALSSPLQPSACVGPPDFRTGHGKAAPGVSGLRSASHCPRPFSPPLASGLRIFAPATAKGAPGVPGLRSTSHCPRPFSPPLASGLRIFALATAKACPVFRGCGVLRTVLAPSVLRLRRASGFSHWPRQRRARCSGAAECFALSSPLQPSACVGPPDFRTGHGKGVPGVPGLRSASHCPRPFSPPLASGLRIFTPATAKPRPVFRGCGVLRTVLAPSALRLRRASGFSHRPRLKGVPGVPGLRSASHCPRPFSPPLCVGPPDFRTGHAQSRARCFGAVECFALSSPLQPSASRRASGIRRKCISRPAFAPFARKLR